jgi:hypothetical protein
MSEGLRLILFGFGWVIVFAALGSGPANVLSGRRYPRILLAPVLGVALAPALMTTGSLFLTMNAACFAVLVPAAVISLVVAFLYRESEHERATAYELAAPVLLGAVAVGVALLPGLIKNNVGPFTYAIADVWLHVTKGMWLAGHTSADSASPAAFAYHLPLYTGWSQTVDGFRLGLPSLNAAFARGVHVGPEETYFALGAVIFGLLPVSIWMLARRLGAGLPAAAFGALYGLAACALTLVVDGAAENLAGMVIAPLAYVFAFDAFRERTAKQIVVAGICWGGLLAVYPEYVPPIALAGLLVGLVAFGSAAYRSRGQAASRLAAAPLVGIAAVALLVAPYSVFRDVTYYRWLIDNSAGSAVRHLTLEDVGAWAFGVLHLYQLANFDLLSTSKTFVAVAVPILLLTIALIGAARSTRVALPTVLVPAVISVLLAVYLYWYRTDNEYALWKWLLLALPFVFVLLALGIDSLLASQSHRSVVQVAVAVVALIAVATIVRADVRFTRLVDARAAFVDSDVHKIVSQEQHLENPSIFLEGADGMPYPLVDYVGLYSALLRIPHAKVFYDPEAGAPAAQGNQLLRPALAASTYEQPDYRYIFTTFSGLERSDRVVAADGRYALLMRRPTDVVLTGASAWTSFEGRTVPYAVSPVQLWVASPRPGVARLVVRTPKPSTGRPLIGLRLGNKPLSIEAFLDGAGMCATVPVQRGFTRVDLQPLSPKPTASPIREWQSDGQRVDGVPPVTQAAGVPILAIAATAGTCHGTTPEARSG